MFIPTDRTYVFTVEIPVISKIDKAIQNSTQYLTFNKVTDELKKEIDKIESSIDLLDKHSYDLIAFSVLQDIHSQLGN